MRRRLIYGLVIVFVVPGIAGLIAKYYLSNGVTPQVIFRLQSALGMPVQIENADVGISGGSELKGVQVFEPNPSGAPPKSSEKPWFRIDRVEADVSALGLASGSALPTKLSLHGVSLVLRFDKDGNLLTHLPASRPSTAKLPELVIDDGRLTIDQQGRKPMKIEGIRAVLTPSANTLTIEGSVTDPHWGHWKVGGKTDVAAGEIVLKLETPKTDVTAEKLREIPFIPPGVWQQVMAEGSTSVRLTLRISGDEQGNHYRVELEPQETTVHVPSIELKANQASGKVIVDDRLVSLSGVSGRTADGSIGVNGTLDFRKAPSALSLDVAVKDVAVQRLPGSWEMPDILDGNLSGTAKLRLRLTDPPIETEGSSGEGTVAGVSVLGLGKGSARIFLHPGDGRIRFRREPPPEKKPAAEPRRDPSTSRKEPATTANSGAGAVLNAIPSGLQMLANGIADGTSSIFRGARALQEPPRPDTEPSYFEANLSLQDVDLGEFVRRAKLKLPFKLEGKLSFHLNLGFPADRPRDFKAYRFQGEAKLPRLSLDGFEMADVRARVTYANGILTLHALHAATPLPGTSGGSFDGSARYQILPAGELSAKLHLEHLPVALIRLLVPAAGDANGNLSGDMTFRAPGDRLTDLASWQADWKFSSDTLSARGVTLKGFTGSMHLSDGVATVSDAKTELSGSAVTLNGKLSLKGAGPFDAELRAPGVDLELLQRLEPAFRPPVAVKGRLDVAAKLKGALRSADFQLTGDARSPDLTLDTAHLAAVSFRFALVSNGVKISDLKANLYKGTLVGTATLPLKSADAGDIALQFKKVDANALVRDLPSIPIRLDGNASGSLTIKVLAALPGKTRETTTVVDLKAPDLRVQGIPTQHLRCTIVYRGDGGSYKAECELAGGTFKLEGKLPPRSDPQKPLPTDPAKTPRGTTSGLMELRDVRINQLIASVFPSEEFNPLRGYLSVDLPFDLSGDTLFPNGRGAVTLSDVRWGETPVTDRLVGELRFSDAGIGVSNVSGTVGQGDLRASAGYTFARGGRAAVELDLRGVEASRLLAVFPKMQGLAEGSTDIRLRLSGGSELRGSGRAVLTRGRVLGVDVVDWQIPLEFTHVPGVGGQLVVRDSNAQIARGRAIGRASLNWGDTLRLDGNVHFFDADLRTLLGKGSEIAGYAGGQLTGNLDFNSENFRSIDDLNAAVSAKLQQAQTSGVPVLQQIVPFIALFGASGSTRFQNGDIRARLTHGAFRVQRFSLTSEVLQLILEGTVNLNGRLDLEATAGPGNIGDNSRSFSVLGVRIPAPGPLPLAVLIEASTFLANRIIHLRITGSYANPVVRVEPKAVLSEETVRFFFSPSNFSGSANR